jgi:hypothetical protein
MIEFLECRLLWTVHCNTTQRSFAVFELSGHCKRHDQLLKTDWSLAVQMIVRLRQLSAITADANQLLIFYLVQIIPQNGRRYGFESAGQLPLEKIEYQP